MLNSCVLKHWSEQSRKSWLDVNESIIIDPKLLVTGTFFRMLASPLAPKVENDPRFGELIYTFLTRPKLRKLDVYIE